MSTISVKGLSVSFGRKRVLTNIYLEIEKGKIYGVIGPNGAGKSTLFKAILDLLEIDNGILHTCSVSPYRPVNERCLCVCVFFFDTQLSVLFFFHIWA